MFGVIYSEFGTSGDPPVLKRKAKIYLRPPDGQMGKSRPEGGIVRDRYKHFVQTDIKPLIILIIYVLCTGYLILSIYFVSLVALLGKKCETNTGIGGGEREVWWPTSSHGWLTPIGWCTQLGHSSGARLYSNGARLPYSNFDLDRSSQPAWKLIGLLIEDLISC